MTCGSCVTVASWAPTCSAYIGKRAGSSGCGWNDRARIKGCVNSSSVPFPRGHTPEPPWAGRRKEYASASIPASTVMGRQTAGRSPVWVGIGILFVSITLAALWARSDWLAVAGVWLTSVGLWLILAYGVWTRFKSRQRWLLPVGISLIAVSSVLLFVGGPVLADPVASLGILALAAIASWREGDRWGQGLFTVFFIGFLLFYALLYYGARR